MGLWSPRIVALGLGVLALGGPAGADMTKPAPVPPSASTPRPSATMRGDQRPMPDLFVPGGWEPVGETQLER